jgi:hypothetical protein
MASRSGPTDSLQTTSLSVLVPRVESLPVPLPLDPPIGCYFASVSPLAYEDNVWGGDYDYIVFGRLHPRLTLRQGIAELDILEKQIVEEHKLAAGLHVEVHPMQDVLGSPVRASLAVLLSAPY